MSAAAACHAALLFLRVTVLALPPLAGMQAAQTRRCLAFAGIMHPDMLHVSHFPLVCRYAGGSDAALLGKYGVMSSLLGVQPWCTPSWEDFQTLAAVRTQGNAVFMRGG